MVPRLEEVVTKDQEGETVIVEFVDEPSYVTCRSKTEFVNPSSPGGLTAKQVNATLNLNLGLPINPENKLLRPDPSMDQHRWRHVVGRLAICLYQDLARVAPSIRLHGGLASVLSGSQTHRRQAIGHPSGSLRTVSCSLVRHVLGSDGFQ